MIRRSVLLTLVRAGARGASTRLGLLAALGLVLLTGPQLANAESNNHPWCSSGYDTGRGPGSFAGAHLMTRTSPYGCAIYRGSTTYFRGADILQVDDDKRDGHWIWGSVYICTRWGDIGCADWKYVLRLRAPPAGQGVAFERAGIPPGSHIAIRTCATKYGQPDRDDLLICTRWRYYSSL